MKKSNIIFLSLLLISTLNIFALDLSLRDAAEIALTVSPDLSESRAKIGSASINYRRQITQFLPQITLVAGKTDNVPLYSTDSDQYNFSAQVSQPIFNGGRTYLGRKLTKMQIIQQENEYLLQEESIMDQVWELYFGILTQKEKVSLYKRALEITDFQIQVSRVKMELGELTELDLLEAEIQYNTFKSNIATEELSLEKLEFQLKRLLFIEQHINLELTDTISKDYSGIDIPYGIEELYDIANANNLTLKKSGFELASIKAQLQIDKMSYLPQISLNGSYGLNDNDLPLQNQTYSINLEFSFPFKNIPVKATFGYNETVDSSYTVSQSYKSPISNDFSYIANRKATKLTYQAMQERLSSARETLYSDLFFYLKNLEQQKETLKQLREESNLYLRKTKLMKLQLELGETKLTDYLEAEKTSYEKEYAIIESVLALKKSERELEKMLGLPLGEISNVYAEK